MSWEIKQNQGILEKEKAGKHFRTGNKEAMAFLYPNSYNIGMSNLGCRFSIEK
jgi:hypothetical protein